VQTTRGMAVNALARWWGRIGGAPTRALARRLSSRLPSQSYDGINLAIADPRLESEALHFFAHTQEALRSAATRAPKGYAELRKDIRSIVLMAERQTLPYHRFQLAALVPLHVARESDVSSYASWLLYVSGLLRGRQRAMDRAEGLLLSLNPGERQRVRAWLAAETEAEEV
jgi:hypothetical protein